MLRGLAVIAMVMGHSIDSVLSRELRLTGLFQAYEILRGFTAPMFLVVSGFAFAVVTFQRWNLYTTNTPALRSRITKMLFLLGVGYALHFPFFSLNKILYDTTAAEYALMLQVDILHCLAVSILVLQGFVLVGRTPQRFAAIASVAGALAALAAPALWSVPFQSAVGPVLAPYFNQQVPSLFPLFPTSAYLFSGAAVGTLYSLARTQRRESAFPKYLALAALALAAVALAGELLPLTVYPAHDFWKAGITMFLVRLSGVLLVVAGFASFIRIPAHPAEHLMVLGRSSLMVYIIHLVIVYGSPANKGLMQLLGQTLPAAETLLVAVLVLLSMLMLVHLWNYLRHEHHWPSRLVQAGITSTLLYFFLTNPY